MNRESREFWSLVVIIAGSVITMLGICAVKVFGADDPPYADVPVLGYNQWEVWACDWPYADPPWETVESGRYTGCRNCLPGVAYTYILSDANPERFDYNANGVVDLYDAGVMRAYLRGPDRIPVHESAWQPQETFDADGDGDIDLADWCELQRVFLSGVCDRAAELDVPYYFDDAILVPESAREAWGCPQRYRQWRWWR